MMNPKNRRRGWYKSSYSSAADNCVQIAFTPDGAVAMRDSKNPNGPMLSFTAASWTTFLTQIRRGTLNA